MTIATLPFDIKKVKQSIRHLEIIGGKELVAEACNVAAAFESMTRIVDATGRVKPPDVMLRMVKLLNIIGSKIPSINVLIGSVVVPMVLAVLVIKLQNK